MPRDEPKPLKAQQVVRLVKQKNVDADDFKSHRALGYPLLLS